MLQKTTPGQQALKWTLFEPFYNKVQEEEKRSKLPANWEAKRRRVEWELADEQAREEASKAGLDYNVVKNMGTSYFSTFQSNNMDLFRNLI